MERGTRPACCPVASCRGDDKFTVSCQYFAARVPEEIMENTVQGGDDYIEQNLPIEYLLNEHREDMKKDKNNEGIVLFSGRFSQNIDGSANIESTAVAFVLQKTEYLEEYNDHALAQLRKFFAFLHPIITTTSKPKIEDIPVMSPRELLEYRMIAPRPLEASLYSLATGEIEFCTEKIMNPDNPTYQNQYLATILASDALLRTIMTKPGEFQLMFGEVVQRQKTSRQFLDLCSAFQLTPSRTFSKQGPKMSSRD